MAAKKSKLSAEERTPEAVMARLESLGSEATRRIQARHGATAIQFGVKLGDIRKLAAEIGTDHALAHALWKTDNFDARILAALVFDPKALDDAQIEALFDSLEGPRLADELVSKGMLDYPGAESLSAKWRDGEDELRARAGWMLLARLISGRTLKKPDCQRLLAQLEREMLAASKLKQEAMNQCLVYIGTTHPEWTDEAVAIGERLGRFDDRPVPKGCTAPYAPEWIAAVLRNKKARGH